MKSSSWQGRLGAELPVFGHRNWIVIADSAYPAQTSVGVETVYTGGKQLEVLQAVLTALEGTRHVSPVVHLDAELAHVPESLSPGVDAYREGLMATLTAHSVLTVPHEEMIARLNADGKLFRVLILKTDLTIPYSSVFLQLDCGYWGPDSENKLREAIAGQE